MITSTLNIEKSLWNLGYSFIAGVDEVGRGCFAGPVCVGAVIFPKDFNLIEGIADSKLLRPKQRERLAKIIQTQALSWAVAEISVSVINKIGIGRATQMAMRKAIRMLNPKADFVVFDAFYNFNEVKIPSSAYIKHFNRKNQKAIKNGDTICASISAASIIAKVYKETLKAHLESFLSSFAYRDKLMKNLSKKYPNYGFSKHKGYGTKFHQDAIKKYGLTKLHRKSFNLQKFL